MSANTNSTDASIGNQTAAQVDLKDYLEERSELANPEEAEVHEFPKRFSKRTYERFRSTVGSFLELIEPEVMELQEVKPKHISRYNRQMQRAKDGKGLARTTREKRLETLRVFFDWAESEWRAPTDPCISDAIQKKIENLNVSGDEFSRAGDDNHRISKERANQIVDELVQFHYPSRQLIEFLLIWHIGLRSSAIRSINCGDVHPRKGIIKIRNRPKESGVRLKRGSKGERNVNVSSEVMTVVSDYIDHGRKEPKDGSDALLTSAYGRVDKTTLYRDITSVSACGDCGYSKREKYKCEKSIGAHDLRRSAITRMRGKGLSWEAISGQVNAAPDTLRKHYDSPTFEEDAQRRREEVLRNL